MLTLRLLDILRSRVSLGLIKGVTEISDPSKYPFESDKLPLMCDSIEPVTEGYTSGFRSSLVKLPDGSLLKSKGIGIPSGNSRPIVLEDTIYTYYLKDVDIGGGQVIWGFSTLEEAESELRNIQMISELGLPIPKPIGFGKYQSLRVIEFKDRVELFNTLASIKRDDLLKQFKTSSKPMKVACIFVSQQTDVRVDEILYGFLHPKMDQLLSRKDSLDFLEWMGSSCGLFLRAHHDAGILHGTNPKQGGFITNAHSANHLVDENGTYVTDYHLAYRSQDKELRREEIFFLASKMNPLPHVMETAVGIFGKPKPLFMDGSFDSFQSQGTLPIGWYNPKDFGNDMADAFVGGVSYGYNRSKAVGIEHSLRSKALLLAALCKRELFRLLGLPQAMERGVTLIGKLLSIKKFDERELKDSYRKIESEL